MNFMIISVVRRQCCIWKTYIFILNGTKKVWKYKIDLRYCLLMLPHMTRQVSFHLWQEIINFINQSLSKTISFVSKQGDLEEVNLIAGPYGYISQCENMDAQCPTCGQFTQLHNLVNELSFSLIELRSRVSMARQCPKRGTINWCFFLFSESLAVIRRWKTFIICRRVWL